jgi:hypothetical protein
MAQHGGKAYTGQEALTAQRDAHFAEIHTQVRYTSATTPPMPGSPSKNTLAINFTCVHPWVMYPNPTRHRLVTGRTNAHLYKCLFTADTTRWENALICLCNKDSLEL